jgi:DNA polymerase (family 10)
MLRAGAAFEDLPGIGEDLAGKMPEIIETGHLEALEDVEARTTSTLTALT